MSNNLIKSDYYFIAGVIVLTLALWLSPRDLEGGGHIFFLLLFPFKIIGIVLIVYGLFARIKKLITDAEFRSKKQFIITFLFIALLFGPRIVDIVFYRLTAPEDFYITAATVAKCESNSPGQKDRLLPRCLLDVVTHARRTEFLKSVTPSVRETLEQKMTNEDIDYLIRQAENVRANESAVWLMGQFHHELSTSYLIEELKMGGRFHGANDVERALIRIGSPAVPQLLPLLRSKDSRTQDRVVSVLAEIGDERAMAPLAHRFLSGSGRAGDLAHFGVAAFPYFLQALKSKHTDVRTSALFSLAYHIDWPEDSRTATEDKIIAMLGDRRPEARAMAARVLGARKVARSLDSLRSASAVEKDLSTKRRMDSAIKAIASSK